MGGIGSGQYQGNSNWRGGKSKKTAVQVAGSGTPQMPEDLDKEARVHWHRIVELTQGVAFEQDSNAIAELARLCARQDAFNTALEKDPLNESLNRTSLAIGRAMHSLRLQFGLTPRSRQILVVPVDESEEPDELEILQRSFQ